MNQPIIRTATMPLLAASACLAAIGAAGAADAPAPAPAAAPPMAAHWQAVPVDMNYSGFTSLYSCPGIEDKLRVLVKALGARGDARFVASGCNTGTSLQVSRFVSVRGQFQVLVAGEAPAGGETVQATWKPVLLQANRPFTVGEGDCELVEQLKPTIEKAGFVRGLRYDTRCIPHQVNGGSFIVTGEALAATAVQSR